MVKLYSLLGGALTPIFEYIGNIISALYSLIPKTIYLISTFIMQLIDLAQLIFKKLAGIDVYYVYQNQTSQTAEATVSGDIVEYFVKEILIGDGALHNAFIGIVIIGACLLFLSTLLAIFRTQYMAEDAKSASPKKAIGNAIKAIVSFIVVPAACLLGVMISGQILQAIESATNASGSDLYVSGKQHLLTPYTTPKGDSTYIGYDLLGLSVAGSNTTPISGVVFRASAYKANRIRNSSQFRAACQGTNGDEQVGALNYSVNMNGLFDWAGDNYEPAAATLDDAFANCYKLKTPTFANISPLANPYIATSFAASAVTGDFTIVDIALPVVTFSKYRVGVIWYYYDLWQYDFIIAIGSITTILVIFINMILGLTKRIFEIAMLTVVSPGLIGIMPLDGGAALKKWRESYIKKTIGAYSAVFCINIFYLLLPVINNLGLFGMKIIDNVINVIFIIAGLISIKDLIKLISEIIGAENYEEVGQKMSKDFVNKALSIGGTVSSFVNPAKGIFKKAVSGSFAGILGGAATKLAGTGFGKSVAAAPGKIKKAYADAKKNAYVKKNVKANAYDYFVNEKGTSTTNAKLLTRSIKDGMPVGGLDDELRERYEKQYDDRMKTRIEKSNETKAKMKTGLEKTQNFANTTFQAMSEDQEWGFAKMKERNEKGNGISAIVGKYSNANGGSTKVRKMKTSQDELEKQQKTQSAVFEQKKNALKNQFGDAYKKAKDEDERSRIVRRAANEYEKGQGSFASKDQMDAIRALLEE